VAFRSPLIASSVRNRRSQAGRQKANSASLTSPTASTKMVRVPSAPSARLLTLGVFAAEATGFSTRSLGQFLGSRISRSLGRLSSA
jgi:hypothetical protein